MSGKPYKTPSLRTYGNIQQITQSTTSNNQKIDAVSQMGGQKTGT